MNNVKRQHGLTAIETNTETDPVEKDDEIIAQPSMELEFVSYEQEEHPAPVSGNIEELPVPREDPQRKCSFSTVSDSDRRHRHVSLSECIALALENGRTGALLDSPGSRQSSSVTGFSPLSSPTGNSDSIRVFAFDPAIAATNIEESLARFDVFSQSTLFWNRIDEPSRIIAPPTEFEQLSNRAKVDNVDLQSGLYKRLATGGFAGMAFRSGYENNFIVGSSRILDPAYRSAFELVFEQPLLQGAGVFINQVRDAHPGSVRQSFPDFGQPPGILLFRISHRQSQLEFERQVHELLFRVEQAYWNLYCAYWDLYSADNGVKQAFAAWQIAKARYDAGGIGIEDLAMIEEQYHFFRNQRVQALGRGAPGRPGVLEAERALRYVIGLPAEDSTRLIPADTLAFVAYNVDTEESIREANEFRPELRQLAEAIKAAHLNIVKARDRLKPDLRAISRYDINSLGDEFGDGFGNIFSRPRHQWEVGMRLLFPIGRRAANSATTRARLQLLQRLQLLNEQRQKLIFSLQRSYRDLVQFQEQYQIRKSQRIAAARQLEARFNKFKAGGDPKQPGSFIDLMLRAQRNWVDALREEYAALCSYRTAIADFERQKGTILQFANVSISEGPLPAAIAPEPSRYIHNWHMSKGPDEPNEIEVEDLFTDTISASWPSQPEIVPSTVVLPSSKEKTRNRPQRMVPIGASPSKSQASDIGHGITVSPRSARAVLQAPVAVRPGP